jgi:hypothetical protein
MQSKSTIKTENELNPIPLNNSVALRAPQPIKAASPAINTLLDTDNNIYSCSYTDNSMPECHRNSS